MSVVDEIKERLDIVELIGSYLPLQKAGRNYKGLCPFHSEKTPSFIVFPETQGWHCFGACGTGGDIFNFVMRRENMTFPEALRFLAEKAGVEIHPLDTAELAEKDELDRLRAINLAAAQFYHHLLLDTPQGEVARKYLEKRGVTRTTLATFQLGYAPDEWHTVEEHLRKAKFAPEDILTAGLTTKNEAGNVYDRFRGRLLFPIRDAQAHVIGFGGRVLDDSLPKYLNTPQSPLFDKGSVLYGIDLAVKPIRDSGTAIIVEGYMDVIIPYQCGVTNLIACMGTALTEAHMRILKRITKVLILALDPDVAGMKAVERGVATAQQMLDHKVVPVLTASGIVRYEEQLSAEIRVLVLPDGLDPDELILKDRARWDALVAGAKPVVDYFFDLVMHETDLTTAKGKRLAVDRLLPVIAAIDNTVVRIHHLQRLAQRVHLDEQQLQPELERLRGGGEKGARPQVPQRKATTAPAEKAPAEQPLGLEERCLVLLLEAPTQWNELHETVHLGAEAFQSALNRQVYDALGAYLAAHETFDLPTFVASLDTELAGHVESLLQKLQSGPPLSPEMVREDLLKGSIRLRKNHVSRLIRELRFVLQDAQEQGAVERVREVNGMIEELALAQRQIDQCSFGATYFGRKQAREGAITSNGS